jgi:RNA polymerase sigma-70 factor, ECF subfamily
MGEGENLGLIRSAVEGDGDALQELLKANHDRLFEYVQRHLPDQLRPYFDPGDIVQDTFFEACRLIRGFEVRGDDSMFRWLVTMARHHIVNLLRRPKFIGDVPAILEELGVYQRTPSRSAASHEFMIALEESLGRLTPDCREAVTLRHIQGLSVTETAARMNRSNEHVSVLCHRGLRAIAQDLESASYFF